MKPKFFVGEVVECLARDCRKDETIVLSVEMKKEGDIVMQQGRPKTCNVDFFAYGLGHTHLLVPERALRRLPPKDFSDKEAQYDRTITV